MLPEFFDSVCVLHFSWIGYVYLLKKISRKKKAILDKGIIMDTSVFKGKE